MLALLLVCQADYRLPIIRARTYLVSDELRSLQDQGYVFPRNAEMLAI